MFNCSNIRTQFSGCSLRALCCSLVLLIPYFYLSWQKSVLVLQSLVMGWLFGVLKRVSGNHIPARYLMVTCSSLAWNVGGCAAWCFISAGCYIAFTLTVYHLQAWDWFHPKWSCNIGKKTMLTLMSFLERYLSLGIRSNAVDSGTGVFWSSTQIHSYKGALVVLLI